MTVNDARRAPFCWQSIPALKAIRSNWDPPDEKPSLRVGLSVYRAITEVANESRARAAFNGESEGFEATRRHISDLAGGLSDRSVDFAIRELERLGLLRVDRRRAGDVNLPSIYVLVEPGQLLLTTAGGGEGDSLGANEVQEGREPDSQGVAKDVRTVQEEREEGRKPPICPPRRRLTAASAGSRDRALEAWAAEWLPDETYSAVAGAVSWLRRTRTEITVADVTAHLRSRESRKAAA